MIPQNPRQNIYDPKTLAVMNQAFVVAEGQDDRPYKEADDSCVEKAADGAHEDDQHGNVDAAAQ